MFERSIMLWKLKELQILTDGGNVSALRVSFGSHPELLEMVGADRQVVSHALTPMPDGDLLLSLFLERR